MAPEVISRSQYDIKARWDGFGDHFRFVGETHVVLIVGGYLVVGHNSLRDGHWLMNRVILLIFIREPAILPARSHACGVFNSSESSCTTRRCLFKALEGIYRPVSKR